MISNLTPPKDRGGPAFPGGVSTVSGVVTQSGMALRDWFASQADIPWEAAIEVLRQGEKQNSSSRFNFSAAEVILVQAQLKYLAADAMLKERNK